MFSRIFILFVLLLFHSVYSSSVFYDTYHGTPITTDELKRRDKANTTFWCVSEVKPCDPNEWRHLDGSCNNLKHPSRGAAHTPFHRVLPAVYSPGFEPRLSKSGGRLPLARFLRTSLLCEGKSSDPKFTQLVANYLVFMSSDVAAVHDTVNYVLWTPYCCLPKGKTDNQCTPNEIPANDPVHRFSGNRCINMTRPLSFQTSGCLPKDTTPERINTATPLFDMSTVYGNVLKFSLEKGRLFKGGLLKFEIDNAGRIWPPSTKTAVNLCLLNEKPYETRCHNSPDDGLNSLFGINLVGIWFWRNHNRIANKLASLNPCWNDDRLFFTARDINIASYLQILFYELFPLVMGRKNLIREGVISASQSFRDIYNEQIIPQMSLEYLVALRWVHTIQEGSLKLFKEDGSLVGEYPIVNLTLRTGYLARDNNIELVTQGSFRQAGAKVDYGVDPDIVEVGLGPHQKISDISTNDLAKNRYFGFSPYVRYLEFCRGRPYNSFDDLLDVIDLERVDRLKDVYENYEDIDLTAALWVEKFIKDGHVPHTFFCLVVEQLTRSIASDRHWYERAERPNAFSAEQLKEIRKATISRLLCDNGDSVTKIQPRAFERISKGNELCSCESLEYVNLKAWKDPKCGAKLYDEDR